MVDPGPCPDDFVVKVDIGANCDVYVTEQILVHGTNGTLTGQNLTSTNGNSPAGGPPANLLVSANVTSVLGRTNGLCPSGIPPEHFSNGSYTGRLYVPSHYIS